MGNEGKGLRVGLRKGGSERGESYQTPFQNAKTWFSGVEPPETWVAWNHSLSSRSSLQGTASTTTSASTPALTVPVAPFPSTTLVET